MTRRMMAAGLAVVAVYGRDEGHKDFSEALYILKLDGKVRRNGWPAEEFLFVKREIDEDGKEHLTILRGSDDGMWRPEQTDLLAEDWAELSR